MFRKVSRRKAACLPRRRALTRADSRRRQSHCDRLVRRKLSRAILSGSTCLIFTAPLCSCNPKSELCPINETKVTRNGFLPNIGPLIQHGLTRPLSVGPVESHCDLRWDDARKIADFARSTRRSARADIRGQDRRFSARIVVGRTISSFEEQKRRAEKKSMSRADATGVEPST